jgi:PKD repeat protein
MDRPRRILLVAAVAALGALLGFAGLLESCQPANRAPLARFTFSPKEPRVGQPVTFDATGSRDPDGKIVSYLWDFGDGTTAQDAIATHVFSKDGDYDVALQVTDDRGASSQLTKTVTVLPPNKPPLAKFTVTPQQPRATKPVTFDASESSDPDGTITAYSWEFGDQTIGEGKTVTHVYQSAGTYTVKLTVTDDKDAKASATQQITVQEAPPNEPPFAKFTFTPATARVNEPVTFDASESRDDGQIVKYEWDFGDGSTGEGQTASHTYTQAGTFIVKLTVTDDQGAVGSTTRSVLVRLAVESFAAPGTDPSGLVWDGTHFWVTDTESNKIYKLDQDGKVLSSFDGPGTNPLALAWDGEHLWVADDLDEKLYQLDPQTGEVLHTVDIPDSAIHGIAWDGQNLWVIDDDTGKLIKLDADGKALQSFSFPDVSAGGLTWDGKNLWMSDSAAGLLLKIDPGTGKQLKTIPTPGPDPRGLAWDGRFLWVVDGETLTVQRVSP